MLRPQPLQIALQGGLLVGSEHRKGTYCLMSFEVVAVLRKRGLRAAAEEWFSRVARGGSAGRTLAISCQSVDLAVGKLQGQVTFGPRRVSCCLGSLHTVQTVALQIWLQWGHRHSGGGSGFLPPR